MFVYVRTDAIVPYLKLVGNGGYVLEFIICGQIDRCQFSRDFTVFFSISTSRLSNKKILPI